MRRNVIKMAQNYLIKCLGQDKGEMKNTGESSTLYYSCF